MEGGAGDEPVKDGEGSVFAILGVCNGNEQFRAFTPICCGGSQTRILAMNFNATTPGNSVNEVGEGVKGGVVKEGIVQ